MWERVTWLMQGAELSQMDMETRLMDIYDKFKQAPRESMELYYQCFSQIMNDLEWHKILPKLIVSNTKFLNSLQEEWKSHVTFAKQTQNLHTVNYDNLFDYLKPNQWEAIEFRAQKLTRNRDPLALVATT